MKLKTMALCVSLIGLGAAGVLVASPQAGRQRDPASRERRPRAESKTVRRSDDTGKKHQPALQVMDEYVIEPPDLLDVEVLEALPGRPIKGERLVRPDGKISLGYYGDVYVAGRTVPEARAEIVKHLRKYLSDETLGLLQYDKEGEIKRDAEGKPVLKIDSDRLSVEVMISNSKSYYVLGAIVGPGRMSVTGHETILDAINQAGGLTENADHKHVVLYRMGKDRVLQKLPVDIDEIMLGDDPTTNYQLLPGDRLVVPSRGQAASDRDAYAGTPADNTERTTGRRSQDVPSRHRDQADDEREAIRELERRLEIVERKLDRMLDALEGRER